MQEFENYLLAILSVISGLSERVRLAFEIVDMAALYSGVGMLDVLVPFVQRSVAPSKRG